MAKCSTHISVSDMCSLTDNSTLAYKIQKQRENFLPSNLSLLVWNYSAVTQRNFSHNTHECPFNTTQTSSISEWEVGVSARSNLTGLDGWAAEGREAEQEEQLGQTLPAALHLQLHHPDWETSARRESGPVRSQWRDPGHAHPPSAGHIWLCETTGKEESV